MAAEERQLRLDKEQHPERYCRIPSCLWRTDETYCARHTRPGSVPMLLHEAIIAESDEHVERVEERRVLVLRDRPRSRAVIHALDCPTPYIQRYPEKYAKLPESEVPRSYRPCRICGGGRTVTPP